MCRLFYSKMFLYHLADKDIFVVKNAINCHNM